MAESEKPIKVKRKQVEAALDEYVRPLLATHGGDMMVDRIEDGVVYFRMLGHCAGCAAADLTSEDLINKELVEHVPGVKKAVLVTGYVVPALPTDGIACHVET